MQSFSSHDGFRYSHSAASDNAAEARQLAAQRVYPELRRIALRQRQADGGALRTETLLREASEQLLGADRHAGKERLHFQAIAAAAVRQLLVEQAQIDAALADDEMLVEAGLMPDAPGGFSDWLALDQALHALQAVDPQAAEAVELHLIGGLSHQECAEVLHLSPATVAWNCRFGRAWLHSLIGQDEALAPTLN